MSKEIISCGWNLYVKNDWTKWAEKHGIVLSQEAISKPTTKRIKHVVLAGGKLKDKNLHDELKRWYEDKKEQWENWTIELYKEKFNKRPYWAKTFYEREISRTDVEESLYRVSFKIPNEYRVWLWEFCRIERELVSPDKNIIVERFLNKRGQCRHVNTIFMGTIATLVRQEEWISKGEWAVTGKKEVEWMGNRPLKILKSKKPLCI